MTLYCIPTGYTRGHMATEYYEMDYTVIIKRCIFIMKSEIQMLYRSTVEGN